MRKVEKAKTLWLKNIVARFGEREPIEYLRGIAYNVKYNVI